MALTVTKDTAGIRRGGGSILFLRQVDSAGADLGTPDTNHDMGEIRSTGISDITEMFKEYNEAGKQVAFLEEKRDCALKFELMQTDNAHILDIKEEVRGKYYRVYYQGKAAQGGKIPEYVFGICRVTPRIELSYKDGETAILPIEIAVLNNSTAITVANNTLPSSKVTSQAMDISANKLWSHVETTPA
jgi:hypothetical protein